jgi:isovaleryl-CoA dehydrogenase
MLFVNNLSQNGSHEQKLKYLPDACTGKIIGGMGMSESGGGTDVLGMATTALITAGDDDNFVMNGSKMWITNGTLTGTDTGDIFLVYAKTGPRKGAADLTSFIGTVYSNSLFLVY